MAQKIEIFFLGTSSAVPTKRRNHTGILLKYKEQNFLFDCGEGIQRQFRISDRNPCKLTKIFISHWHGDHFLGLSGLIQTLEMNEYGKKLEIYGPIGIKKNIYDLLKIIQKTYLLDNKNIFHININEINDGIVIDEDEYIISSIKTNHNIESLTYSFLLKEKNRINKEKLKELNIKNSPLLSEIVKGKKVNINGKIVDGKKITYKEKQKKITFIFDTKYENSLINFAKSSDLLICESTYSAQEQELASKYYHLSSKDAANIANKSHSERLILTHLSQRYSEIPNILRDEAKKNFKNVNVAEDFDKIEI